MRKWFIVAALIILFGFAIYQNQSLLTGAKEHKPEEGFLAPDFTVMSLDGTEEMKLSELKGKPVFINFWASWCYPCELEMPDIHNVYNKMKDDVHFVMLNTAVNDPVDRVTKYVDKKGYTFPVWYDEGSVVTDDYKVISFPTTYFIDHTGQIAIIYNRMLTQEQIEGVLLKLVEKAK